MKMNQANKQIVMEALQRIEYVQEMIENVEVVIRYLSRSRRPDINTGNLRDLLFQEEVDEWRKVAMWGLTLDTDEQDRIKVAVHDRFLRDGMSVTEWFNNGIQASSWLEVDEKDFRVMAAKAFAPRTDTADD